LEIDVIAIEIYRSVVFWPRRKVSEEAIAFLVFCCSNQACRRRCDWTTHLIVLGWAAPPCNRNYSLRVLLVLVLIRFLVLKSRAMIPLLEVTLGPFLSSDGIDRGQADVVGS
jgi:hypothetical protein